MKYTKTTIKELTKRYATVLKKCAFLNAIILGTGLLATPAMADSPIYAVGSGVTETITSETIDITSENGRAVQAGSGAQVTLGGENTQSITLNAKDYAVLALGAETNINITGKNINITSEYAGVHVGNNTDPAKHPDINSETDTTVAEINITGDTINIKSTDTTDGYALGAMSQGRLIVEGNTTLNAINAIVARGGATVKVNKSGNHTVDMTGNINFNYDSSSSNTSIDALVDVTLAGTDSVWNGNTVAEYDTLPEPEKFKVTQMTLNMKDGAVWNAKTIQDTDKLGYVALNNLNIATGTVNIEDTTRGITVGKLIADNATFNAAGKGGNLTITDTATITNSTFQNGTGANGGAINNLGTTTVGDTSAVTTFKNNITSYAGGAIYNAGTGKIEITNALFEGNESLYGGAVNNSGVTADALGTMKITNTVFKQNKGKNGGAVRNQGEFALANVGSSLTTIHEADFIGNESENGGAIWNGARGNMAINTASFMGNKAVGGLGQGGAITNANIITLDGEVSFTNNSAETAGGAIHNAGTMTFNGTTTFSGNTAGGKANDINNLGTLTFNGDTTLSGGITGTGTIAFNGSTLDIGSSVIQGSEIAIKDGATLKADLMSGTAGFDAATLSGNNINLIFDAGSENGTLNFAQGNAASMTFTNDNTLFDIVTGTDTVTVTKKATSEITEELTANTGMDETTAMGVVTMTEANPTTPQAQLIADEIVRLAQSSNPADQAKAGELAKAAQPTRAAVHQALHTNTRILNAATNRMAARSGRNGGDLADVKLSPWVKGLFNKTHNSQGDGFDAYSRGYAFGVDAQITEDWLIGVGYAKTNSTVKEDNRRTHVNGDNYFVYGKYQPAKWYIESVLNYGHAKNKAEAIGLTGRYDVDTYSAQLFSGYQYGIADNYAGLRYTYVKADDYNNGLNDVKGKNTQVATAVIGTRISKEFDLNETVSYTPEFRLAGTYDIKSDNSKTNVNVIGGSTTYSVDGKRLHRAALEAGVGLTGTFGNMEVSAGYDIEWRVSNFAQTGMLKLKYNF